MRPLRPLVAAVVLACLWTALREGVPRASVRPAPAGGTGAWAQPRYSDLDRVEASLSAWAESDEERIRLHRLASSRDRRPLLCLELAPGGLDRAPDAPRPWTLLVVGGLDGRSLAGCHAAMLAAERLVKALPALRRDVRVLLVPLGAPDALARAADDASRLPTGRNTRPIDDDLDGAEGEDPPDDLDGDGLVLEMLVEDPDGPWALTEKPRRLVPAGPGAGAGSRGDEAARLLGERPRSVGVLDEHLEHEAVTVEVVGRVLALRAVEVVVDRARVAARGQAGGVVRGAREGVGRAQRHQQHAHVPAQRRERLHEALGGEHRRVAAREGAPVEPPHHEERPRAGRVGRAVEPARRELEAEQRSAVPRRREPVQPDPLLVRLRPRREAGLDAVEVGVTGLRPRTRPAGGSGADGGAGDAFAEGGPEAREDHRRDQRSERTHEGRIGNADARP